MKVVGYICVFIFGLVACYLLLSLGLVDTVSVLPPAQNEPALRLPTYLSFVAVMLTSVTVVLAAVAIGIGVVAAYTFREIKDTARNVADKAAQERSAEALSDDVIRARINEIAFGNMRAPPSDELEEDFDPNDKGER